MLDNKKQIKKPSDVEHILQNNKIDYHLQIHQELTHDYFTNVSCEKNYSFEFVKNLVFKTKSDKFIYYCLKPEQKMNTKALEQFTGEKGLIAADDNHLEEYLCLKKWAVNPFSLLNLTNEEREKFIIVVDSSLEKEYLLVHPMVSTHSIWIKKDDLFAFLQNSGLKINFWNSACPNQKLISQKDESFLLFNELLHNAEIIDYYDIEGCFILRPKGYYMWEVIKSQLDAQFKMMQIDNYYFPMFINEQLVKKDISQYNKTAFISKSGLSSFDNKIGIRESSFINVMSYLSKVVKSYRDLPVHINRWVNNVNCDIINKSIPFLNTLEYFCQEGYSCHANNSEQMIFINSILEKYVDVIKNTLSLTFTLIEENTENKRTIRIVSILTRINKPIEIAKIECFDSNISKFNNISFLNKNQKNEFPLISSWTFSMKSIGACLYNHSNNQIISIPPKIAQIQLVLIPVITEKDSKEEASTIIESLTMLNKNLKENDIRSFLDSDLNTSLEQKILNWEKRGILLRIELGKKDIDKKQAMIVDQYLNKKDIVDYSIIVETIASRLRIIQEFLLQQDSK